MRSRRRASGGAFAALAAAGLAAAAVAPAGAQELATGRAGRADSAAAKRLHVLAELPRSPRIRVATADSLLVGVLVEVDSAAVALAGPGERRRVPLAAVTGIWTRRRATKLGALVGGSTGMLLGSIFGAAIGEIACAETGGGCTVEAALVLGALTGAGGAGVGALVGLAIPRWKRRFP